MRLFKQSRKSELVYPDVIHEYMGCLVRLFTFKTFIKKNMVLSCICTIRLVKGKDFWGQKETKIFETNIFVNKGDYIADIYLHIVIIHYFQLIRKYLFNYWDIYYY